MVVVVDAHSSAVGYRVYPTVTLALTARDDADPSQSNDMPGGGS